MGLMMTVSRIVPRRGKINTPGAAPPRRDAKRRVVPLRGTLTLPLFSPGLAHSCAETWGSVSLCIFDARLSLLHGGILAAWHTPPARWATPSTLEGDLPSTACVITSSSRRHYLVSGHRGHQPTGYLMYRLKNFHTSSPVSMSSVCQRCPPPTTS